FQGSVAVQIDRLRKPRRGCVDLGQIAAPARARHVVDVDVRARRDVDGRGADWVAVLHDRLTGANAPQRDLVAAWNALTRRHHHAVDGDDAAGVERLERGGDVVTRADHENRVHWLTPLARMPPSTASSCPVTNVDASDA